MSTLAENLQHGYLAPAVEAAAEKSEPEVASLTDLFMESRPSLGNPISPYQFFATLVPKSEMTRGRNAARSALRTARTSITSWVSAPATGLK